MAKRATHGDKTVIDPLFSIPEGAEEEFTHSQEDTEIDDGELNDVYSLSLSDDFGYTEDGEYLDYFDEGTGGDNAIILDTPESFDVIAQFLRRAPGGQQVVDIVVEVADVAGAENYEIQVTKVV